MEIESMEESRDFKLLKTEMFMYKILYSALEKMVKTNCFERCLKKKLMFLMNPVSQEDLPDLEKELSNQLGLPSNQSSITNFSQPAKKELVGVLGLSSDMMSQLNIVNFTQSEILLIQDIYFKELPKLLKELSASVIEIDSEVAPFPRSLKSLQTLEESFELSKEIHNLVLDNNSEIENNVQLQNNLIKLKYKTIPKKELKKIVNCGKNKLKDTLQLASNLHEDTLNAIYPTEDCKVRMKDEICSLEQELSEINRSIEELSQMKEQYQEVDIKELKNIAGQYKVIKSKKRMLEMTLREINKPFRFNNSVHNI